MTGEMSGRSTKACRVTMRQVTRTLSEIEDWLRVIRTALESHRPTTWRVKGGGNDHGSANKVQMRCPPPTTNKLPKKRRKKK